MKPGIRFILYSFLGSLCLSVVPCRALTPMDYYNSLVAGADEAGFRDGAFYQARFSHPAGLCWDDKETRLFVADMDNHRIRAVDLEKDNEVSTVAGSDTGGTADGPLDKAQFLQPTQLALVPPNFLVVYDGGGENLRVLDLDRKQTSTLPLPPLAEVWSLVYSKSQDALFLSQPAEGKIQKLDWKTKKLVTLLEGNPQLPHPKALCASDGFLYAADQDLPGVYQLDMGAPTANGGTPVTLVQVGKGEHVQALAGSMNFLYAIQTGEVPLARVLPNSKAVSLATPWGFMVDFQHPGIEPLLRFDPNVPVGFLAPPNEERKLFISLPERNFQDVISVKDYDFDLWWKTYSRYNDPHPRSFICDFEYPKVKAPGTFRVLIVGESRVLTAPVVTAGARLPTFNEYAWTTDTVRTDTFPKQLELLLNTEGSLRNLKNHFEVLVLGAHGDGPSSYAYDVLPVFVKQYDIDLVLILAGKSNFEDYFTKPMRPEGIPTLAVDPEYLLKPLENRVPPGVPAHFYQECKKMGFVGPSGFNAYWFQLLNKGDSIRNDLLEMTAKPLSLFEGKLKALRTSSGSTPRMAFFYVPWSEWGNQGLCESFWVDLCRENHWDMADLTAPFNAMKISYYPTAQVHDMNHYTNGGNRLIAELLSYYLVEWKWIPLDKSSVSGEP